MALASIPMSVLVEAYKALVLAEAELRPSASPAVFWPVCMARCSLEARLGLLPPVPVQPSITTT